MIKGQFICLPDDDGKSCRSQCLQPAAQVRTTRAPRPQAPIELSKDSVSSAGITNDTKYSNLRSYNGTEHQIRIPSAGLPGSFIGLSSLTNDILPFLPDFEWDGLPPIDYEDTNTASAHHDSFRGSHDTTAEPLIEGHLHSSFWTQDQTNPEDQDLISKTIMEPAEPIVDSVDSCHIPRSSTSEVRVSFLSGSGSQRTKAI